MENLPYIKKRVIDLIPNDIVLHPIYRCDGLLLVNRFKIISPSLIEHIRRHLPKTYPVLIVNTEAELKSLIQNQHMNSPQFLNDLNEINKQYYSFCKLSIKRQELTFMQPEPEWVKKIEPAKNENSDFDKPAIDKSAIDKSAIGDSAILKEYSIFSSPLWMNLNLVFDSIVLKKRSKQIQKIIIESFSKYPMVYSMIAKMRKYHDALWIHSLNTTCISLLIGLSLELSNDELVELVYAAMFADIGFLETPKEEYILYLNIRDNENFMVNEHLKKSIELASQIPFLRKKSVILGIYEHHENYDGSGVPLRKKRNEISLFGRIIRIAQIYDEMTGGYFEEKSIGSYEAERLIWGQRGTKIDPDILKIFLYRSCFNKIGGEIQLDPSTRGVILGFTNFIEDPIAPIVKLDNGEVIDLYQKEYIHNLPHESNS